MKLVVVNVTTMFTMYATELLPDANVLPVYLRAILFGLSAVSALIGAYILHQDAHEAKKHQQAYKALITADEQAHQDFIRAHRDGSIFEDEMPRYRHPRPTQFPHELDV